MKVSKLTLHLDNLGIIASILCAIHCAAIPLLISTLPLWGIAFLNTVWIEIVMIGISLMLGSVSLGLSYFRNHRKIIPLLLLMAGFLLIAVGHFTGKFALEILFVPLGGFVIASAHFVNWHLTNVSARTKNG